MANFNFSTAMLEEGTTFIFGSWICMANGHGGFHSHRADATQLEADQCNTSNVSTGLADDLSKIQISDLLGEQPSPHNSTLGDQEDDQSETFFDLQKVSDNLHPTDATKSW
jgi:hypothetical protein